MIKANELRIGNLILFDGKITHANTRNIAYISNSNRLKNGDSIAFEPVDLTEEWLLKAGFKKDKYRMSDLVYFENGDITIDLNPDGIFKLHIGTVFIKNIHLVHKLQNFYFEYEGSELVFSTEP